MITEAEEIGQRAVEIFRQNLPTNVGEDIRWIPRDLTGRDFGIDMAVEVFVDKQPTGRILLFQIKGKKESIPWDSDGYFNYQHTVRNLLYAEKFNIPFILCLVELESKAVYWLWMQRYIQLFLDRDSSWRYQDTKVVTFSINQRLDQTVKVLSNISAHPQRIAHLVVLAGYTKECRSRLAFVSSSLALHLEENYPLSSLKKDFPLFKYYLKQVIENPIWQDKDFPAACLQLGFGGQSYIIHFTKRWKKNLCYGK